MQDEAARFWSKVDQEPGDGCWEWRAAIRPDGYGAFMGANARTILAHRFAFVSAGGTLPKDLTIDHMCRNRRCVRPSHLEAVTLEENKRRGMSSPAINARKTHCDHGHEFTPENTILRAPGGRNCRQCKRDNDARLRAAMTPEQREAQRAYNREYHLQRKQTSV